MAGRIRRPTIDAIVGRMEQGKQSKRVFSVRLSAAGYEHVRKRAEDADVDVSHMARRMLSYAATRMPAGWVPPKDQR